MNKSFSLLTTPVSVSPRKRRRVGFWVKRAALAVTLCAMATLWTMRRTLVAELEQVEIDPRTVSRAKGEPEIRAPFATLGEALAAGAIKASDGGRVGERVSKRVTYTGNKPLRILRGEIIPGELMDWMVVADTILYPSDAVQSVVCDCIENYRKVDFKYITSKLAKKKISAFAWWDEGVAISVFAESKRQAYFTSEILRRFRERRQDFMASSVQEPSENPPTGPDVELPREWFAKTNAPKNDGCSRLAEWECDFKPQANSTSWMPTLQPSRERLNLMSSLNEKYAPEYERLIKAYFEILASGRLAR